MKVASLIFTFMFSVVLLVANCTAEDLYVRLDASGANNGLDWGNAWSSLSVIEWGDGIGKLGPGDTLWIAGGEYGSLVVKGGGATGARLLIKRASAKSNRCFSAKGWQPHFDSQVILSSIIINKGSYLTIDGVVDSGILVRFGDGEIGVKFRDGSDFAELKHLEIAGPAGSVPYYYQKRTTGIYIVPWNGRYVERSHSLQISHSSIHGAETLIQAADLISPIIEHCNFYDSVKLEPSIVHPNVLYIERSNDGVFRYNEVWNMQAEGILFATGIQTGWKIYGNIFRDSYAGSCGRGIETHPAQSHGSHEIYNNTFVNLWMGVRLAGVISGSKVFNNIFWKVKANSFGIAAHDYNYYDGPSKESHGIQSLKDPFINYSEKDYRIKHLSSAAGNGQPLPVEFSLDKFGNNLGAMGKWDIGAYSSRSSETHQPSELQ